MMSFINSRKIFEFFYPLRRYGGPLTAKKIVRTMIFLIFAFIFVFLAHFITKKLHIDLYFPIIITLIAAAYFFIGIILYYKLGYRKNNK